MSDKEKRLIIVESPAKIKTLKKFLGSQYSVESSVGHIRDLPKKGFGIDIEHNFEPTYEELADKKEVIKKLRQAAKQVDCVYLSPDPDREGEAIAWHIMQVLPPDTKIKRVTFNSLTRDTVLDALKHPREIDYAMVNAQQARRLLDRIVGYKISPILNRRMQRGRGQGLSAGRVQSVALKLVVDREREIANFKPVEYWNLGATLSLKEDKTPFQAHLYSVGGKRVEKEPVEGKEVYLIPNGQTAEKIVAKLKKSNFKVEKVERKEKRRNPVPPFITSTLQQEASRHHGFSSARTMSIAQGLYEGVDLGSKGTEGLITYMRTDSVRIAPEAINEARRLIESRFGKTHLPETPRYYSSKESAQDAHEAIRPTHVDYLPEQVKEYLSREQYLLYELIWKRFIASQMSSAVYDTVTVDIETNEDLLLRATGSQIRFPGFLAVYEEKLDEEEKGDSNRLLPNIKEGDPLDLLKVSSEQAFTKPPPRFSEASLVRELERCGIGRPSTYASIMSKIQGREYTLKEKGRLKPTELGQVIAQMLEENFQQIMDVGFTAHMEDDLEEVAQNNKEWKKLLADFWGQFEPVLEKAEKDAFPPKIMTDISCPSCKTGKLQKIWFKDKYFFGCSNYPDCNYRAAIEELTFSRDDYAEGFDWDQPCPLCGKPMQVRHGRFGSFLGCTDYPNCRGIVNLPKKGEPIISQEGMPPCPAIGCTGQMRMRKSRFGKIFYSCSTFPECDVIVNDLAQLEEKYSNYERKPYEKKGRRGAKAPAAKKTATKKAATKKPAAKKEKKTSTREMAAQELSPEMQKFLGEKALSRGQVTKKLWDYIKQHGLQDPQDKRMIRPDAELAKLFGSKEPISMFHLAKVITPHFKS